MARTKVLFEEARTPAAAYENVARWHEAEIEANNRKIHRAEEWSAANNDGRRDLAGLMYTDTLPTLNEHHRQIARRFRRLAKRLNRRAQPNTQRPQAGERTDG